MILSKRAIEEFKELYLKEFKEQLSDDQAEEMASSVLSFFKIICRPIPGEGEQNPHETHNNKLP